MPTAPTDPRLFHQTRNSNIKLSRTTLAQKQLSSELENWQRGWLLCWLGLRVKPMTGNLCQLSSDKTSKNHDLLELELVNQWESGSMSEWVRCIPNSLPQATKKTTTLFTCLSSKQVCHAENTDCDYSATTEYINKLICFQLIRKT